MGTMVAGMFQNSNEKRTNSINKDVHQSNDYSHSMKQKYMFNQQWCSSIKEQIMFNQQIVFLQSKRGVSIKVLSIKSFNQMLESKALIKSFNQNL